MRWFGLAFAFLLAGCINVPDGITPVDDFDSDRYLGKWYEIARLDHRFERGLSDVSAEYSLREDGGIRVKNRGFSTKSNDWDEAIGKAFFVDDEETGFLKVSFFGPFYGSYVVFELDKANYQYAFVAGPNKKYLWFLSRTPTVSDALIAQFRRRAEAAGFPVEELILVDQQRNTTN
ncbi:MAG: lipocalin family protein [Woeseiaceae bacterium]